MSKADDVFGPLAGPLVKEWGSPCTFVHTGNPGTYDPATGKVTTPEITYSVKAVMLELEPQESNGLYQETDFMLILDPGQINDHYITTADKFIVPFPGGDKTCKVINVTAYRGEKPISFECVVRPQ